LRLAALFDAQYGVCMANYKLLRDLAIRHAQDTFPSLTVNGASTRRRARTVTSPNGGKGAGMGDKGGKKDKEKGKQQQVKKQKQKDQRKQEKNRPRTP
jgi:hypothetical protein